MSKTTEEISARNGKEQKLGKKERFRMENPSVAIRIILLQRHSPCPMDGGIPARSGIASRPPSPQSMKTPTISTS